MFNKYFLWLCLVTTASKLRRKRVWEQSGQLSNCSIAIILLVVRKSADNSTQKLVDTTSGLTWSFSRECRQAHKILVTPWMKWCRNSCQLTSWVHGWKKLDAWRVMLQLGVRSVHSSGHKNTVHRQASALPRKKLNGLTPTSEGTRGRSFEGTDKT